MSYPVVVPVDADGEEFSGLGTNTVVVVDLSAPDWSGVVVADPNAVVDVADGGTFCLLELLEQAPVTIARDTTTIAARSDTDVLRFMRHLRWGVPALCPQAWCRKPVTRLTRCCVG